MTLWHGMTTGSGFLPTAVPTARTARGRPMLLAICPYVRVCPCGIFVSARQTARWKGVPSGMDRGDRRISG